MAKHIIPGSYADKRPDLVIITEHVYPALPDRRMDWEAVDENYDYDSPVGRGATEQEAINNLLEQMDIDPDEPLQRDAYDPDRAYEDARDERIYERLYGYPCMGDE